MSGPMKFLVEIPESDIQRSREHAVNRQQIAKLIRQELKACGGNKHPDDWEWFILRRVKVTPYKEEKTDGKKS